MDGISIDGRLTSLPLRKKAEDDVVAPTDGFTRQALSEPGSLIGPETVVTRDSKKSGQPVVSDSSEIMQPAESGTVPIESKATDIAPAGGKIHQNSNGTLSVIPEAPTPSGGTGSTGEMNFARLYGVDGPATAPQHFTRAEVDRFYLRGEELSPEGMRLYETLKTRYIDEIPRCKRGSPALYLTGGLPGSGKGFILSKIMKDEPQFVLVDPDEIKKHILRDLAKANPELKGEMAADRNWSDVIHETSSIMAKRLMNDALRSGKDIVFDSSMATKNVDKYRSYARTARANGYRVYGLITNVTEDTANQRALMRAGKPTDVILGDGVLSLPGRLTRSDYIHDCAQNLQSNLDTYLQEGIYDRCTVFDNNEHSPDGALRVMATYTRQQNPDGTFTMKELTEPGGSRG